MTQEKSSVVSNEITAQMIANYLIAIFQEAGEPVTSTKLQKLLYCIQGWYLGLKSKALFAEDFQAWIHGPVIPELYNLYKDKKWHPLEESVNKPHLPDEVLQHVTNVLEIYGDDSAISLEIRTHREAPWLSARGGIRVDQDCSNLITKESMQSFFAKEAENVPN